MNMDDSYFDHNSVFWQVYLAGTVRLTVRRSSDSDANYE